LADHKDGLFALNIGNLVLIEYIRANSVNTDPINQFVWSIDGFDGLLNITKKIKSKNVLTIPKTIEIKKQDQSLVVWMQKLLPMRYWVFLNIKSLPL